MTRPFIIGIAGGTGSGKTSIVKAITKSFGGEHITVIPQDSYYKVFNNLTLSERNKINFDHPRSFDHELLIEHLKNLKNNVPIQMPIYDYKTHTRTEETILKPPNKIIILEGILIFADSKINDLLDIKIFVDTDADVRILRRIERDMKERDRSLESIIRQYRETVRPMHNKFVEPSKRFADVIIPEGSHNRIGVDMIISKVHHILRKHELKEME